MKVYTIKAKKFLEEEGPTNEGQYVVQEIKNEFTIWNDYFSEVEDGEDPIFSELNDTYTFNSLTKCKDILVDNDCVEEESYFRDIHS